MKKSLFLFLFLSLSFSCNQYIQTYDSSYGEVKVNFSFSKDPQGFSIKKIPEETDYIEIKVFGDRINIKNPLIEKIKKSDADPKTGDAKLELKKVPIGDKYVEVRAYDKDKNILSSDREEVLIKASEVVKVTLDLKEGDLPELTKEELAKIENKENKINAIKKVNPSPKPSNIIKNNPNKPKDPNQKPGDKLPNPNPSGGLLPNQKPGGPGMPNPNPSGGLLPNQKPGGLLPNPNPSGGLLPNPNPSGGLLPNPNPSGGLLPNPNPSGGLLPNPNPSGAVLPNPNTGTGTPNLPPSPKPIIPPPIIKPKI
ncbi:MAG: hypothetical protein AABZ74_17485 [Cyanobacteriota bacterium]